MDDQLFVKSINTGIYPDINVDKVLKSIKLINEVIHRIIKQPIIYESKVEYNVRAKNIIKKRIDKLKNTIIDKKDVKKYALLYNVLMKQLNQSETVINKNKIALLCKKIFIDTKFLCSIIGVSASEVLAYEKELNINFNKYVWTPLHLNVKSYLISLDKNFSFDVKMKNDSVDMFNGKFAIDIYRNNINYRNKSNLINDLNVAYLIIADFSIPAIDKFLHEGTSLMPYGYKTSLSYVLDIL